MCYRHLNSDQRSNIALLLRDGMSFSYIAEKLGVHKSTISREVKRNSKIKESDLYDKRCQFLDSSFIVCNNCPKRINCQKTKKYYDSQYASTMAFEKRHGANKGPNLSLKEFKKIDDELYRLVVVQGLSIEASRESSEILKKVSSSTLRNWVNSGLMKAKPINLKIKKKLKPLPQYNYSKQKKALNIVKKPFRTMSDYKAYIKLHPNSIIVQTDSVEGKKSDEKAILTIYINEQKFQIGHLYDRKDSAKNVYEYLKEFTLKILEKIPDDTSLVFVTDNGVEFAFISQLEDINERIRVYFARPYCSTDKANCERNHEFYRYIYPKGHSFNDLTQDDVDNMFSNINSYIRKSLRWKSPCTLIAETYGDDFLASFNISKIEPDKVNLRPRF